MKWSLVKGKHGKLTQIGDENKKANERINYSQTRRNETRVKLSEAPRSSKTLGILGFIWTGRGNGISHFPERFISA
jgi:hypothetical protein